MKRVLVCPLDWGLGHATRCIPVIEELQKLGLEVFVASSGAALKLLKFEFPSIHFFELPTYQAEYSAFLPMYLKMVLQLPKFRKVIREEHRMVRDIIANHKVELVISDNRYGCWSKQIESILITHQPSVLMPEGAAWATSVVNKMIRKLIMNFNTIWIPDQDGSGFTQPFTMKTTVHHQFIGWLSRFERGRHSDLKYDVIVLVSGPEPHRSAFEELLTSQLIALNKKSLLVKGQPGTVYHKQEGNLEVVNHLPTLALEQAILSSTLVISRSGYSTIMDLIALGKKAIFVPTPQQPEQLFLASFCKKEKIALGVSQKDFSLLQALEESKEYSGFSRFSMDRTRLIQTLTALVK